VCIVVGLDLSLTGTGICRIESADGRTRVSLKQVGEKGFKDATWSDRESRLRRTVRTIVETCVIPTNPDLIVIEAPAYSRTEGHAFDRAGLWWLVYTTLKDESIPVAPVDNSKRALYGSGVSGKKDKESVMASMVRRFPTLPITTNNEADALALACMGMRHLGKRIDAVPQASLKAMQGIKWPTEGIRT